MWFERSSALAVELRVQDRLPPRWLGSTQARQVADSGYKVMCFPVVIDLSVSHGNLRE